MTYTEFKQAYIDRQTKNVSFLCKLAAKQQFVDAYGAMGGDKGTKTDAPAASSPANMASAVGTLWSACQEQGAGMTKSIEDYEKMFNQANSMPTKQTITPGFNTPEFYVGAFPTQQVQTTATQPKTPKTPSAKQMNQDVPNLEQDADNVFDEIDPSTQPQQPTPTKQQPAASNKTSVETQYDANQSKYENEEAYVRNGTDYKSMGQRAPQMRRNIYRVWKKVKDTGMYATLHPVTRDHEIHLEAYMATRGGYDPVDAD